MNQQVYVSFMCRLDSVTSSTAAGRCGMDPVSIGVAVAVLAGKKLVEKVGSEAGSAGWGLANRMIANVRSWFAATDPNAAEKLDALEAATDPSDEQMAELAALIDSRLPAAPAVEEELESLRERAEKDPVLQPLLAGAGSVIEARDVIVQNVSGDRNIVVGKADQDLNITTSQPD